eukprot:Tbor_TRINITY_DN3521_c0_g1::TRINITY_DN3521_c0_g1_i1::g.2827::m.2827/K18416/THEX1, ERI1; 3'-5' exoribonuclease 1
MESESGDEVPVILKKHRENPFETLTLSSSKLNKILQSPLARDISKLTGRMTINRAQEGNLPYNESDLKGYRRGESSSSSSLSVESGDEVANKGTLPSRYRSQIVEAHLSGGSKGAAKMLAKQKAAMRPGGGSSLYNGERNQKDQTHKFSHLFVIDFEATCDCDEPNYPHEIIEFPVIVVDTETACIVAEFHTFVKPVNNPILTEFCKTLTGIKQSDVNNAPTLPEAIEMFQIWIKELEKSITGTEITVPLLRLSSGQVPSGSPNEILKEFKSVKDSEANDVSVTPSEIRTRAFVPVVATDGPWDMRKFMHQCAVVRDGIAFPRLFYQWIDVRRTYSKIFHRKIEKLTKMLRSLGMSFIGERHRGIDDARNIARIVMALIQRGYKFQQTCKIQYEDETSAILACNRQAMELIEKHDIKRTDFGRKRQHQQKKISKNLIKKNSFN